MVTLIAGNLFYFATTSYYTLTIEVFDEINKPVCQYLSIK